MCTGYMAPQSQRPQPKPEDVPLGDGLAQRAKLSIQMRRRRIDEAVDAASR